MPPRNRPEASGARRRPARIPYEFVCWLHDNEVGKDASLFEAAEAFALNKAQHSGKYMVQVMAGRGVSGPTLQALTFNVAKLVPVRPIFLAVFDG